MSSELSDALNPNIVRIRRQRPVNSNAPVTDVRATSVAERPRPFVPHRSELELAIAEPPPDPPSAQVQSTTPAPRAINAVHELLRVFSATKEAAEAERRRRIAWEQEQEAKSAQRQAEMERQLVEMRREMSLLKAYVSLQPPPMPVQSRTQVSSAVQNRELQHMQYENMDLSSVSQANETDMHNTDDSYVYTSLSPIPSNASIQPVHSPSTPCSDVGPLEPPAIAHDALPQSLTPPSRFSPELLESQYSSPHSLFPSPQMSIQTPPMSRHSVAEYNASPFAPDRSSRQMDLPDVSSTNSPGTSCAASVPLTQPSTPGTSMSPAISASPTINSRKRVAPSPQTNSEGGSSDDDEYMVAEGSRKRINGHDTRCLTIHHAMRLHLARLMKVEENGNLPDSHSEECQIQPDEPMRFVWEKTAKQSEHNVDMKKRVVADIKVNRRLYKHVPEKEFAKRNLETVFDQVFTTLRQRYRAQKDSKAASDLKRREEQKARKARRLSRKKLKLANRIEMRKALDTFAHSAFDGALQQECMSSEESGEEDAPDEDGRKIQILLVRGLPWRSVRLQRFFATLDEEDRSQKSTRPKRGVGRKDRRIGPYKEEALPPLGVAGWMISKRWSRLLGVTRPDLAEIMKGLIVDHPEFDWNQCLALGAESDDDLELQEILPTEQRVTFSNTNYSLQYALTPFCDTS